MNRPGRGNRKKGSNKVRGIFKGLLLAVIIGYIVWASFNYAREVFRSTLVKVELAKYGSIRETISMEGILVRDEMALSVPTGGKLEIAAQDGERVRVGALVAEVKTPDMNSKGGIKSKAIISPAAGIVSYQVDGMENVLQLDNIDKIDALRVWNQNTNKVKSFTKGQQVQGGEVIAKIVNNLSPMYIIGEVENNKLFLSKVEDTGYLMAQLNPAKEQPVMLDVVEVSLSGEKARLMIELNDFTIDYISKRAHKLTIITNRFEGYIVPVEAIVRKENKNGIYTVYKNTVRWQPVKIEGEIGEKAAISGLGPDTSYIANPQYAEEGQAID